MASWTTQALFLAWRSLLRKRVSAPPVLSPHGHPDLHSPSNDCGRCIAVLVYPGVTTTEIAAPVEHLAQRMSAQVLYVAAQPGTVQGVEPVRTVHVDRTFDSIEVPIDVVVVPGGLGWQRLTNHPATMSWLRTEAARARGVMAISTGSLLLGATGRLRGRDATGHWLARDQLASMGANVQSNRVAADEDHLLVTASGAIAALELVDTFADRLRWGP